VEKKRFEDKYIVLTGGAGFIGSALLRHLNDQGITNIVVVDDLGRGEKWKNLVGKRFSEILPSGALFDWLEGREEDIEAFIHLGACSSTTEQDASYLLENNTRYSVRLCEYAMWHNHRFIYASSAATYGNGEQGYSDDHDRLQALVPLNMYGYSKHLFDLWAQEQGILDQVVGLKYFNVYGPNEYHKESMASAILKLVPQIQKEGVIRLFRSNHPAYEDGEQKRDFIYVKDAVRMTTEFLYNRLGGIFNIGTGRPTSWNTLGRAVAKALGVEARIEYMEMPAILVGSYQNFSCADMSKYESHPELTLTVTPLEEAVADYVNGYLLPGKRW
jgi:ADP-L-glycero-D-manno-heptose 6-epimerase